MYPPGTIVQSETGPLDVRRLDGNERLQVLTPAGTPAYRQVRRVVMGSAAGRVYCVSTSSGRRFCATPDHPFAFRFEPSRQYHDLFLAKREGLGFFLVTGNGLFRDTIENRVLFKRQEPSSKESVWLLSSHATSYQAAYEQMLLSCQYGIPNFPNGGRKGERLLPEELFRRLLIEVNTFARARRLLADKSLDEDLPHWLMRAVPEAELPHRQLVDVVYFGGEQGSHRVSVHPLSDSLRIAGEKLRNLMTRRMRFEDLRSRPAIVEHLEKARKDPFADVQERLRAGNSKPFFLMPLAYARPGTVAAVLTADGLREERIEQAVMERYEGPVFGIDLDGEEPLVAGGLVMGLGRPGAVARPPEATPPRPEPAGPPEPGARG
ncbi:MAG: hypothetical protein HY814_04815 [Candidatus Riflebacteria bacterium]|nr:hypothetical protein [Candidatus Riflebacteria bacterium]